jgi:hypothetical protein
MIFTRSPFAIYVPEAGTFGRATRLSSSTGIARDLGVDGDDAIEFMLRFQDLFNFDLSHLILIDTLFERDFPARGSLVGC